LLHELSHSFVAQSEGIPVSSITLFVFGGVSNISREPQTARDEFLMAAAGPAMSLVIGIVSYGLLQLLHGAESEPVRGILIAMAFYNVTLAIFNLIPGFPLDGGRVFRAIVWAITGSFRQATTIATAVGHFFAYLFIFSGLFLALSGAFLGGLWLVFIGWFLNNAASLSQQQAQLETATRGVKVRSVMRSRPPEVPASASLAEFVENYVLAQNLRALPVVSGHDCLAGLVTLSEVRAVPRADWATTTVDRVMIPRERLVVAQPDEPLDQALGDLSKNDLNQLPVVDHGELVGLLTRADVIRFLQVRRELDQNAA
jgi:Zn-dependent protease/CBS domain-containing protein